LQGLSYLFFKSKKKSVFKLFTVRHIFTNKIMISSLRVILIAIITIGSLFSLKRFISNSSQKFKESIKADYLLANINDYNDDIKEDLMENYSLDAVSPVIVISNAFIKEYEKIVVFFISLEYDDINTYYQLEHNQEIKEKFSRTDELYIILPETYKYIHKAKVNDKINFVLSPTIGEKTFTIAGFFPSTNELIAFSNYINYEDNSGGSSALIKKNALIIKQGDSFENQDKVNIIKKYGSKMYILLDMNKTMDSYAKQVNYVSTMLLVLVTFISICFIIVIINNCFLTFDLLRADYAQIRILGISKKQLFKNITKEALLIVLIAFLIAFPTLIIMFPNFPYMMIIFGFYVTIPAKILELLLFSIFGSLVFVLTYLTYYLRIRNVNLIDTIRKY